MSSILGRIYNRMLSDIKKLMSPHHFYFIQGHPELTEDEVAQVSSILHSTCPEIIDQYEKEMTALIGEGYGMSFAAGRMAFYSVLNALNIGQGDEVILLGFTCSVMVNAVLRTGAKPIFTDIDLETFGSDPKSIKDKITNRTKMVVAQHTFGIPCKIEEIKKIVRKRGIFLVEDCALTLGSTSNGTKVGNFGDAAIFSTDHTKPLNTLIGGFLYTRNSKLFNKITYNSSSIPQLDFAHQERLYNELLYERDLYEFGHHRRAIFRNVLTSIYLRMTSTNNNPVFLEEDYGDPIKISDKYPYPSKMPSFLAQIGIFELKRWHNESKRRTKLLEAYISIVQNSGNANWLPKAYQDSSLDIIPLRFIFTHSGAAKIKSKMEKYLSTNMFWFKQPIVCCPAGMDELFYIDGTCRRSEEAGKNIINWPCAISSTGEEKILDVFKNIMCS